MLLLLGTTYSFLSPSPVHKFQTYIKRVKYAFNFETIHHVTTHFRLLIFTGFAFFFVLARRSNKRLTLSVRAILYGLYQASITLVVCITTIASTDCYRLLYFPNFYPHPLRCARD